MTHKRVRNCRLTSSSRHLEARTDGIKKNADNSYDIYFSPKAA